MYARKPLTAWFANMLLLTISFALAFCAVVLFLLLQRSLDSASAGRTRSGWHTVQEWISGLFPSAIMGTLAALLLNLLASWLAPKYWGAALNWWGLAGAGALGGMFAHFEGKLKETRRRGREQKHREE